MRHALLSMIFRMRSFSNSLFLTSVGFSGLDLKLAVGRRVRPNTRGAGVLSSSELTVNKGGTWDRVWERRGGVGKSDVNASCDAGDAMKASQAPSHAAAPVSDATAMLMFVVFMVFACTFHGPRCGTVFGSCDMSVLSPRFRSTRR